MDMHPCPGSSQIRAYGYDRERERMAIEFHAGGTYTYLKVPFFVFECFLRANSKGGYLAREIKGKYEVEGPV